MTILCSDQLHFATRKKCLMIPKGQSEAVNGRKTDKIMTKRKNENMTNKDLQHTSQKLKFCNANPQTIGGELRCSGKVSRSFYSRNIHRVSVKRKKTFKFKTALFI